MNLINSYKTNTGVRPLFSEHIVIDWENTLVTGVCRLLETDRWFLVTVSYYDGNTEMKIFNVVEVPATWMDALHTDLELDINYTVKYKMLIQKVRGYFKSHISHVYLLFTETLDSKNYIVKKADVKDVRFFDSLKAVLRSGAASALLLRKYFPAL